MTGVDIVVTRTAIGNGAPRVETIGDVLDLQVTVIDGDSRSQAERNADNAIKAARLERVEARLNAIIGAGEVALGAGAKRVDIVRLLEQLREAYVAPVGS